MSARAVVFAAIVCAATGAVAQSDPAGPGIDLVMLLDRSGSMSGAGRPSPELLIRMALELVARDADAGRLAHRFGAVSFGSAPRVDIPLTSLSDGGAARLRDQLRSLPPRRSLGNTDILRGLLAARQLFAPLPVDLSRRRLLLLVTDGVVNVPGADARTYARALRRVVAGWNDTGLEVLLLPPPGGATRDDRLWHDLAPGRVHAVHSDPYIESYRLVSDIVGTRTIGIDDTLVVPPYLETIVFDLFRGHPAGDVGIFAPDALRPLRVGDGEVRTGDILSSIVVHRPAPGRWRFRKSRPDGRVKIFSQQFFPRGVLLEPAGAVRQYDRVVIAYRVTDARGAPIEELPGYPLLLELTLIAPDGGRRRLRMRRDSAAAFRAIEEPECEAAGRYWTEIDIRTNDADDRVVSVFRDRWSGFRAAPAVRVDCRVTPESIDAPARPFLWNATSAMRIDCVGADARPVEMRALTPGLPARLFRSSLSRGGRPAAAALDLDYLGRGAFRGWLHGLGGPGTYRLQLSVDRTQLRSTHNIRFLPAATLALHRTAWIDRRIVLVVAAAAVVLPLLWIGVHSRAARL